MFVYVHSINHGMNLQSLFNFTKDQGAEQAKLFLALLITDTTVQSGLWQVSAGSIGILRVSKTIDYADEDDLLVKTDQALQELGKESESVNEVILGLEFGWVAKSGISDEKKPTLKRLTTDLSLKAVGFVVITEALFHHLLKKDAQLSTLLLQVSESKVSASVIVRGSLLGTELVGKSDTPATDVEEAIARLASVYNQHSLPPKILIASSSLDVQAIRSFQQDILSIDWESMAMLAHSPTVDLIPQSQVIDAVIQEGGRAVAESMGMTVTSIVQKQLPKKHAVPAKEDESFDDSSDGMSHPEVAAASTAGIVGQIQSFFGGLRGGSPSPQAFRSDNTSPPVPKSWLAQHLRFVIGGFVAGIFALVALFVVAAVVTKKAEVKVTLAKKPVSTEVSITLDSSLDESVPEELLLKASIESKTIESSKEFDTTGVTLIGENATGKVSIQNKTEQEQVLAAGTVLSRGSVAFTLDEEVRIASASVSQNNEGETKTYGKVETTVTASKIGADGNIVQDLELDINGKPASELLATSLEAFTGGSSREVRVFSDDDKTTLTEEFEQELYEQAVSEFNQESGNGIYKVATGEYDVLDVTYDADTGDEVKSVEISLSIEVSAVAYQTQDLKLVAELALADQIPDGFELSSTEPSILSQPDEEASTDGLVVIDANISAQIVPQVSQDDILTQIGGLSADEATQTLTASENIDGAEITITPFLARAISTSVPKKSSSVIVEIEK